MPATTITETETDGAAVADDDAITLMFDSEERTALFAAVRIASERIALADDYDADDPPLDTLLRLRSRLAPPESHGTYSLVAVKPESADYCMGCHMETYPGKSMCVRGLTRAEAVAKLAELKLTTYGPGEAHWSAHVFADGPCEDPTYLMLDDEVRAETHRLAAEREAAAQAAARKAADEAAAAAHARDIAELAQLQAKLGIR